LRADMPLAARPKAVVGGNPWPPPRGQGPWREAIQKAGGITAPWIATACGLAMTGDIVIASEARQSMASAAWTRAVAGGHPEGWRRQRLMDRHGLRPRDDGGYRHCERAFSHEAEGRGGKPSRRLAASAAHGSPRPSASR